MAREAGVRPFPTSSSFSLALTAPPSPTPTLSLQSIIKIMQSNRSPALSLPRNKGDERNPFWCNDKEFIIEEKLDGERMQLHKWGGEYRYWSR